METESNFLGKILAFDVGEKTIGCAIVGEDGIAPEPLPPIQRQGGSLSLGPIRRLLAIYRVHTLVVGLPLNKGMSSQQSRKTKGFIAKLKKHFPRVNLVTQDETLSTWSAKKEFFHLRLKKNKSPLNIDSFAARDILLAYLSKKENYFHE